MVPVLTECVQRQRLLDLIDGPALAPVTLIIAPAGYGKSTVAAQWRARHLELPVGWYHIRAEHQSLDAFLRYLWRAIDAATGVPIGLPAELTVGTVLDRLQHFRSPIVLLINDYHLIENQQIHEAIEHVLRYLPEFAHIIILSRQIPEFSVTRLRMYGKLRVLTQADLAFSFPEVKQVFRSYHLSDDLLRQLTQRSEGWIAGIQLALMSVNLNSDHAAEQLGRLIATMPEHQLLNDYILEEVLEGLPADLRRFVYDTAILEVLEPELCDAVTDMPGSARYLRQLEQDIVFVRRADGIEQPLTYHRLFAECVQRLRLNSGLDPGMAELRLRAARWCRARGDFVDAAKYALAADAWEEAGEYVAEFLDFDIEQADVWATFYWVSRLPAAAVSSDVRLLQSYITALLATGRIDEARTLLASFLQMPGFEPTAQQIGWHENQRAFLAYMDDDREEVLRQSHLALEHLSPDDASGRLFAYGGIYREEAARGNRALAQTALRAAETEKARLGHDSLYWHFLVAPDVANNAALRGDLCAAEELNLHFIRVLPASMQMAALAFHIKLLAIYLEQNRLDLAEHTARTLLEDVETSNRIILHPAALLAIATYFMATGELERGRQALERSGELGRRLGSRGSAQFADNGLAEYWLRTDELALAQQWAERNPVSPHMVRSFGTSEPHALHAQVLFRQGRLDEAAHLLDTSLGLARTCGNVWSELSLLVCATVVTQAMGADEDADDYLRHALELGTPGRFARVYGSAGVDLSESIRALLPRLSREARAHASGLVSMAPSGASPLVLHSWDDAVGFTARERQVLAQLVLGKPNRAIADTLYITERTVKKHLASLFRKTGTANRTALVLWARDHMDAFGASHRKTPLSSPPSH